MLNCSRQPVPGQKESECQGRARPRHQRLAVYLDQRPEQLVPRGRQPPQRASDYLPRPSGHPDPLVNVSLLQVFSKLQGAHLPVNFLFRSRLLAINLQSREARGLRLGLPRLLQHLFAVW